jgi:hypothetical protein
MLYRGDQAAPPTFLRGWLSSVFLPTLLRSDEGDGALQALSSRLGSRAVVEDPIFGKADSHAAVQRRVVDLARWLKEHQAEFTNMQFTPGSDRDACEGALRLRQSGRHHSIPVAVVAERRPSREIHVRTYFSTLLLEASSNVPSPELADQAVPVLPTPVSRFFDAMAAGNLEAVQGTLSSHGGLRDGRGASHGCSDGSARSFLQGLMGACGDAGWRFRPHGLASDGRRCAVEVVLTHARGRPSPARRGVISCDLGESGHLEEVRFYGDIDT